MIQLLPNDPIKVNLTFGVQIFHSVADLKEEQFTCFLRQVLFLYDPIEQIATLHKFKHHENGVCSVHDIVHFYDTRLQLEI